MATEEQPSLPRNNERVAKCGNCGIEGSFNEIAQHAQTCSGSVEQISTITIQQVGPDDDKKMFIWNKAATKLLIDLYAERKVAFNDRHCKKRRLWNEIADELCRQGHDVTWLQVENKWKSLKSCYRRNKESLKQDEYSARSSVGNRIPYLKSLDSILHTDGSGDDDDIGSCSALAEDESFTSQGCSSTNVRPSTSQGNSFQNSITVLPRSTSALNSASSPARSAELDSTEPGWFRMYREDCERRHTERMALQREWMRQQRQVMHDLIDAFLTCKKCRHR